MPLWGVHGFIKWKHSFYVPSNGEPPHKSGKSRSPWQPTSRATILSGGVRVWTSSQREGASGAIECKETIAVTKPNGERSTLN